MNEEQQMQEVVEAIKKEGDVIAFGGTYYCCSSMMCYKLMKWLEDKERGYQFERIGHYWKWRGNGETSVRFDSLWPCLYAAFKHWQSQQKPKERSLKEKMEESLRFWLGYSPPAGCVNQFVAYVAQHIEGKKGEVEEILCNCIPETIDAIMAVFLKESSDE